MKRKTKIEIYNILRLTRSNEKKIKKKKIHRIDVECNTFYKVTEHFIL